MPKPNKSSASAGTRKKHAKKSNKADDDAPGGAKPKQKLQRGQKKLSKAQKKALPKIKQYIPPPKPPAPPIPDPLDGQGLARTLPAELVVVLRRLGKKDDVTRRKGLEELREGWVVPVKRTGLGEDEEIEREIAESALLSAVPVWSPFHRSAAVQLHAELLGIEALRHAILETLSLGLLPGTQNRDIAGSWLVAALEEGRRAGGVGLKSWDEATSFGPSDTGRIDVLEQLSGLGEYLSLSILDPPSLHDDIHPAPVSSAPATPAPTPKAKGKAKAPPPLATPVEEPAEDTEVNTERWARYRVGGLTGLAWLLQQLKSAEKPLPDELQRLIHNSALWSSLSSLDDSPAFGHQQPQVRKAAYSVLGILVESYPEEVQKLLPTLADSLLGSCWLEKDSAVWESAGSTIVKLLSKHREIWQIAVESEKGGDRLTQPPSRDEQQVDDDNDNDGSDDEDSDDDDDDGSGNEQERDDAAETQPQRIAADIPQVFARFLEFVSTTCPSLPHATYPLLLVIISTLPTSLLPLENGPSPQLQTLFTHLWSPVDARLLSTHALPGQQSAFQAFLREVTDCTMYLISKSRKEGSEETTRWLAEEQLAGRVWEEGVLEFGGRSAGRRATARVEQEATIFGQALSKLVGLSPDLAKLVAAVVTSSTSEQWLSEDDKAVAALLPRILPILAAVRVANTDAIVTETIDDLIRQLASRCAKVLSQPDSIVPLETLVEVLRQHSDLLDDSLLQQLTSGVQGNAQGNLAATSPGLFTSLLDALAIKGDGASLSSALSSLLHSAELQQSAKFALLTSLLSARSALLSADALDTVAEEAAQTALSGSEASAVSLAAACINDNRLSSDTLHTILALVSTSIHDSVYALLTSQPDARVPNAAIEIFGSFAKAHLEQLVKSDVFRPALVGLHHLVVLLPRLREDGRHVPAIAGDVWKATESLDQTSRSTLVQHVLADLANLIQDISCRVEPSILVDVATILDASASPLDIARRVLPDSSHIQGLVAEYTSRTPDTTLSIMDSLIPVTEDPFNSASTFDTSGRSKAARLAEAALAFVRSDRSLASTDASLLQTILSARALAQDGLAVPGASRGFVRDTIEVDYLVEIIREAEGALSFSLASMDEVQRDWHTATVDLLKKDTLPPQADFLQTLLFALVQGIHDNHDDVAARTLRDVLERHLRQSGAGEKEAEIWLTFGMSKIQSNPALALPIILAVKPFLLDSQPFITAQNRLANHLSGIPVGQANTKGVPALRLLAAAAPPAESTSVFLPQQRAIFVLRHISGWLTAEEADDLDEEVELRIMEVYAALAPIVQDLPGGHWDAIFDLIETGLEAGTLDDLTSLPLLFHCLTLLQQVRDLCATNKTLRATWTSKKVHLDLVFKLFLQCRDANSVPMQLVQTLILDLLGDITEDIVGDNGLSELSRLIGLSTSYPVQATAYRLLQGVIKRRTLALVLEVEASVAEAQEGQQGKEIRLPSELVDIVGKSTSIEWHEEPSIDVALGQLLAWMAILDHFDDASRTLRWAYLDQLNTSDLLNTNLLPMLFAILGVSEVGAWNFSASQFAVDEFYPDLLEPEELADLTPLASHLFYRSLITIPSALRTYYESLKDRQLSMSMLNFTARHYSPVIIAHEFAALRQPAALAQLTEEGLNVKIASGGGSTIAAGAGASEAIASYVVDEQPMEIGIRLPAEFPLRGVEIRDLRRVGVPENKWRGWLMSVQQTITSRNGLILEALTVFKRNVSLHFEGVVECAICYSIISLTDRTLPTKPCRTCKNRFHASCLYKWFNSSHSSSCPMCRALF